MDSFPQWTVSTWVYGLDFKFQVIFITTRCSFCPIQGKIGDKAAYALERVYLVSDKSLPQRVIRISFESLDEPFEWCVYKQQPTNPAGTSVPRCLELHSFDKTTCQSNNVGDPVTSAFISHRRPTSCRVFCSGSCDKNALTKRAPAQRLLISGASLVLKSLICNGANMKGVWGKTRVSVFSFV